MSDKPNLAEALARIMDLTYPPRTLSIRSSKALGYRLAKPVIARGNQPSRPLSLVDGLAIMSRDLKASSWLKEHAAESGQALPDEPDDEPEELIEAEDDEIVEDAIPVDAAIDMSMIGRDEKVKRKSAAAESEEDDEEEESFEALQINAAEAEFEDDYAESGPAEERREERYSDVEVPPAEFSLRRPPQSNRKDEALRSGQAIPISIGQEVPRGADMVYPVDDLVPLPGEYEFDYKEPPKPEPDRRRRRRRDEPEPEDAAPVEEPPRDWELVNSYQSGKVELPRSFEKPPRHLLPIGSWARNKEAMIPEKAVLGPLDLAMLKALRVEEVEVFRKPVVGFASLGLPFPVAGRAGGQEKRDEECPIATACYHLSQSAQVASLLMGYAPDSFRELRNAMKIWTSQVDVLYIVGGSHHRHRSLAHDVIASLGTIHMAGIDVEPCRHITAGKVNGRPVISMPGSLPEAISAFLAFVRPLSHKYLRPRNFQSTEIVVLEHGSRISSERDCLRAIRYRRDRDSGRLTTRFSGQEGDPWLDYIHGQALLPIEGGRVYSDGEEVEVLIY
ncbi:hypothetical protein KDL44_08205 [bacterium]|nr:hypothetical protein [bacterium]